MKKTSAFFCFLLALTTAFAQPDKPATNALSSLAEEFSRQFTTLATDTTITFEQVRPLMAALFESYRAKARRQKAAKPETRYLIIVTADGLRWQEVFGGADSVLIRDRDCTSDPGLCQGRYWAETSDERRAKLMPFLWSEIAGKGQIYGNRHYHNLVNVANKLWFSYPGYNEMFSGQPDDNHIFTNMKFHNPNTNVLEFLNRQRGLRNRVAAFGTWDVFPYIFNEKRARFPVFAGSEIDALPGATHADESTWAAARNYLEKARPKVLFIGLDDTDHYAHEGDYDQYLDAARRTDYWIAELWSYLQSSRKYRNKTTLLITTDHGRGDKNKKEWRDHHRLVEGADEIWFAILGPGTPALGEVRTPMQIWQKQLAQTIAGLLGHRFRCDHEVAPPVESVFGLPPVLPDLPAVLTIPR